MKRLDRVAWLASFVLLAVVLTGCAERSASPVEATQKDNGTVQALLVDQQLRVSLDANPTTGYTWAVDGELPPQLEQQGEPVYTAASGAIGAGGTEVWVFKGVSAGTGALKLKYWRSFEPTTAPEETFELTVDVK